MPNKKLDALCSDLHHAVRLGRSGLIPLAGFALCGEKSDNNFLELANMKSSKVEKRKDGRARLKSPHARRGLTSSLDDVLAYQLRRAQEASFAAFAGRAGESTIWPGWYALLTIIRDNPGMTQTELSKSSGRDKSTLTTSLRELDRKGLIVRDRDPNDQRRVRLSLSPEGETHLEALRAHAVAHDAQFEAIVGAENRAALLIILKDIAEQFTRFAETLASRS